jgi:hypothetical protein
MSKVHLTDALGRQERVKRKALYLVCSSCGGVQMCVPCGTAYRVVTGAELSEIHEKRAKKREGDR